MTGWSLHMLWSTVGKAGTTTGSEEGESSPTRTRPPPGWRQPGPDSMHVPAGPDTQDQRKEMTMEAGQSLPPSTPDPADLAAQLRAARLAAGHSLAGMAALTHFSKPYLGLVETGRRTVTPEIVDGYQQVLGVSIGTPHDPVRLAHEWLLGD